MLSALFAKFRDDRGGSAAIVFALSTTPILALAGMAVDYSRVSRDQSQLQLVADAAALAGARAMFLAYGQGDAERERIGRDAASAHVAGHLPSASPNVTVSAPARTVQVDLEATRELVFGGLIRVNSAAVAAGTEAVFEEPAAACIVALGPAEAMGIELQGSPDISATKCGIWSNSTSATSVKLQGAPRVTTRTICAVGSIARQGSPRVTGVLQDGCEAIADPFAERYQPITCCIQTVPTGRRSITLQPGIYEGGIHLQAVDATLMPGVYEIRNGPLSLQGNSSLVGSGVTILLAGSATLDFQGNAYVDLTAPSTGDYAGMVIAQVGTPPAGTSSMQGSVEVNLHGSLYLPTQRLQLQGNAKVDFHGPADKAVAQSFSFIGNPAVTLRADDADEMVSKDALLKITR